MREFVFLLFRITGLPLLLRELVQRRRVSILCYHDPRPEVLEAHVRYLRRHYSIISLRQYLDWRRQPTTPLPPKPLILTLDDGHRANYLLRGIFRRHKLPATIFLCSEIAGTWRHFWWKAATSAEVREQLKRVPDSERHRLLAETGFTEQKQYPERQALSLREIKALKPLIDFQSHTRFHPLLPRCSDERVAEEIQLSKTELEDRFGLRIYALAYPNGDYTDREAECAQRAGYECALTIDGGYNTDTTDAFRLRRIRMSDTAGSHELAVKSSGLWGWCERWAARIGDSASSVNEGKLEHVRANIGYR
ncbi:MAG: polysaccharide deacetylase family protein [Gammaproteobacteria bacterium]|nr:polysaccharide deacetylase family protein [Gammaproteobacteria bacterium]